MHHDPGSSPTAPGSRGLEVTAAAPPAPALPHHYSRGVATAGNVGEGNWGRRLGTPKVEGGEEKAGHPWLPPVDLPFPILVPWVKQETSGFKRVPYEANAACGCTTARN